MASVGIIGGGFSGTLTAVQLLRSSPDVQVELLDPAPVPGPGLAYATNCPVHYLNVPAGNMSAFDDQPQHFFRWAQERDATVHSGSFLPRGEYGRYLSDILRSASETHGSRLRVHSCAARDLARTPRGWAITCPSTIINCDAVVLATGNALPSLPPTPGLRDLAPPALIASPWDVQAISTIHPDEPVLLIGAGLTMMDVVMQLHTQGHQGRILAISRHGLLPRPHRSPSRPPRPKPYPPELDTTWDGSIRQLLRIVRSSVRQNAALGTDWRDVITSLRPVTSSIWSRLSPQQRTRFLTRLRSHWDIVRHRAAPETAACIADLIAARQLIVRAAKLHDFRPLGPHVQVTFRPRGSDNLQSALFSRVIPCVGPDVDIRASTSPLLRSLLAAGHIRADTHAIGLDADASGRVINHAGEAQPTLMLVGPMRRAQHWEATAVPELRKHALQVAQDILSTLTTSAAR